MSTSVFPKNTITRTVSPGSIFESAQQVLNSSFNCNQGDLLCFDPTNALLIAPSGETAGVNFLGVARETLVNGAPRNPFAGTEAALSTAIPDSPGPQYGVIARCHLKPGDSLIPGSPVYLYPIAWTGRGVQAAGTKQIGVYQGAAVTGAPSGSPTEIEVLIGHRYPNDTLAF